MERHKPVEFIRDTAGMIARAGRFALNQIQGGGWSELPALPEKEPIVRPVRAAIHYFSTPEIPDNIELGDE